MIFAKSEAYTPFLEDFNSLLALDKPLISMDHFAFTPSTANVITVKHPTLQLFAFTLESLSGFDSIQQAMAPLTEKWTTEGRDYSLQTAMDKDSAKVMLVVGWESVKEHKVAKQDQVVHNAYFNIKKIIKNVDLFGHITP